MLELSSSRELPPLLYRWSDAPYIFSTRGRLFPVVNLVQVGILSVYFWLDTRIKIALT